LILDEPTAVLTPKETHELIGIIKNLTKASLEKMKNGEFPEGSKTLRAKIDMSSSNTNMRDPVLYRITYTTHFRAGDKWCIYPMYDYAHPISDALENITHSLCSMEFKNHRPLYDWILKELDFEYPPKQREFGRMNLRGVVTSKRYLREMVEGNFVDGWDDPRLSTIKGLRRRGYTPQAIRSFLGEIGVSKDNSTVDLAMLEHFIRDDLKLKAERRMAVLNPLKVVITNYPENEVEWLDAENNSENPEMGSRKIPFTREIYIEKDDFMENPPKKYFFTISTCSSSVMSYRSSIMVAVLGTGTKAGAYSSFSFNNSIIAKKVLACLSFSFKANR